MLSPHAAVASVSSAPEPFVSADEAARFLSIKRRFLLSLARRGIAGAYTLAARGAMGRISVWPWV